MRRFAFPVQFMIVAGVILLLGLGLARPASAFPFLLQTTEPTPRHTPVPLPFLLLDPVQGVAGDATLVEARGGLWTPGSLVTLYWDDEERLDYLVQVQVGLDGNFLTEFTTPTEGLDATPGRHFVIAVEGTWRIEVLFELIQGPTPTNTLTATPVTPTLTPTTTPTGSPTPTLRPITPIPTKTPIPSATPRPTRRPTSVPIWTATNTPEPATPTYTPTATATPTYTPTSTPTASGTPEGTEVAQAGTPTGTPTSTDTPAPSDTPAAGTPVDTPLPTPTPEEEMAPTGLGWLPVLLAGLVLASLLIAFRMLRTRRSESSQS